MIPVIILAPLTASFSLHRMGSLLDDPGTLEWLDRLPQLLHRRGQCSTSHSDAAGEAAVDCSFQMSAALDDEVDDSAEFTASIQFSAAFACGTTCTRRGSILGLGGSSGRFPSGTATTTGSLIVSSGLQQQLFDVAVAEFLDIASWANASMRIETDSMVSAVSDTISETLTTPSHFSGAAAVVLDCGRLEVPLPTRALQDGLRRVPAAIWSRLPYGDVISGTLDFLDVVGEPDLIFVVEFGELGNDNAVEIDGKLMVRLQDGATLPLPTHSSQSVEVAVPPTMCRSRPAETEPPACAWWAPWTC